MESENIDKVPSIYDWYQSVFPGGEIIEFCTPEGVVYSAEQMKAITFEEDKLRMGSDVESQAFFQRTLIDVLNDLKITEDPPVGGLRINALPKSAE